MLGAFQSKTVPRREPVSSPLAKSHAVADLEQEEQRECCCQFDTMALLLTNGRNGSFIAAHPAL
jgi:hypothetical protein